MRPFTKIASLLFAVIAIAHLYRVLRPFEVIVAACSIPQWASLAGAVVAGALAFMLHRESRA
ncbi:MAG: hypothetical protein QFC78_11955 [Pseudomonadota bacterium]|nr:hypothetical protein [Pseudomonadota bacterium]